MNPINPLGTAYGTSELQLLMPTFDAGGTDAASASSFEKLLSEAMQQTSGIESQAQLEIAEGIGGGDITLAETVTAVREAELAIKLMQQVQRKLVDTWNELRQMQL
ncbi:MAG: flagellar hook-basal body complex protein FliE [Planctomycetota bacterium]|jgi:flagellar hook-basal body complex protein FliE